MAAADVLQQYEARIAALKRLVGKQALELEFLKGGLRTVPSPRNAPTCADTAGCGPAGRQADLGRIAKSLNTRPRAVLGFRTPLAVFAEVCAKRKSAACPSPQPPACCTSFARPPFPSSMPCTRFLSGILRRIQIERQNPRGHWRMGFAGRRKRHGLHNRTGKFMHGMSDGEF